MVRPIYVLTSVIDINIATSHQAGKERCKVGGDAELLLRDM